MAAFPNFAPSQRSFKPGIYPQRSYRSLSGVVTKRTFGNSPSQATLEMSFDNITKLNAATIVAHYRMHTGNNRRFGLEAITIGDMNFMDFALNYVDKYPDDLVPAYNNYFKPQGQSKDYFGVNHFISYGQNEGRSLNTYSFFDNLWWEYAQPPEVQSIRPNIMSVNVSLIGEIRDPKSDK